MAITRRLHPFAQVSRLRSRFCPHCSFVTPSGTLPVLRNGRLVGRITLDNGSEFLGIQVALGERRR